MERSCSAREAGLEFERFIRDHRTLVSLFSPLLDSSTCALRLLVCIFGAIQRQLLLSSLCAPNFPSYLSNLKVQMTSKDQPLEEAYVFIAGWARRMNVTIRETVPCSHRSRPSPSILLSRSVLSSQAKGVPTYKHFMSKHPYYNTLSVFGYVMVAQWRCIC